MPLLRAPAITPASCASLPPKPFQVPSDAFVHNQQILLPFSHFLELCSIFTLIETFGSSPWGPFLLQLFQVNAAPSHSHLYYSTGSNAHIFWLPCINSKLPFLYFPEKHPCTLVLMTFFHIIASGCLVSLCWLMCILVSGWQNFSLSQVMSLHWLQSL